MGIGILTDRERGSCASVRKVVHNHRSRRRLVVAITTRVNATLCALRREALCAHKLLSELFHHLHMDSYYMCTV